MAMKIMDKKMSRRQLLGMASKGMAMMGVASIAAACPSPAPAPVVDEPVDPEAPREAVTIDFITPGALGLEREMYTSFIEDFMEEHPHIQVNVSFEAWDDYMTKLPTMLAGGVVPDMIHQHMSIVQDYAHRGALLDLLPFMERDGIDPEDYIPALFEAFSHRGATYGIPKDNAGWGIYYNKTMFDEAGVAYPADDWTMEDFYTIALELTRDENGNPASNPNFDATNIRQWGFNWLEPGPTHSENIRGFIRARGGDWYTEDYSETLITDPPAIEHFQMFADMRCADHSIPTPGDVVGMGDPFRTGLTAMAVSFHIMTFFSKQEEVEFDYDVTYMPSGPGGQYVPVGASSWAVPAQAGHQEEGWLLVKFLTSLPVQEFIGRQKRWGVSLREAIDAILPEDGYPEHFAMVHTEPLKGETDRIPIAFKFPPNQSRIREIYAEEFDGIWTCGPGEVEAAAQSVKQQVDALLVDLDW